MHLRVRPRPDVGRSGGQLHDTPRDTYLRHDHCFRFRAFGEARVKGEAYRWDDGSASFFRSEAVNGYAGGVERRYAPCPRSAVPSPRLW
ncbi:2OG-Fe dioxygenase family protein [Streptomyces sp. NPDC005931]|uniref:2OG-Fe dioxygenase family protein n=1 Tax=Streptomyces sp. NPDC005931 TaxID=3364737 RepID=UPI0036A3482D